MVELAVSSPYRSDFSLELKLIAANIDYNLVENTVDYGLSPPYLVVDGVPLDKKRALVWIKEHENNE